MTPIPFRTPEEAWWWFCRMQVERLQGHKAIGDGPGRPCDIDDIAIAFKRLVAMKKLDARQIRALGYYGVAQTAPDRRVDPMGLQAWEEGLDRLRTPLQTKGIVEIVDKSQKVCA